MIEVRVILHSAVTKKSSVIGQTFITNVGGGYDIRNYKVELMRRGDFRHDAEKGKVQREGAVHGHKSLALPIWALVAKALASVGFHSDKGAIQVKTGAIECNHGVLDHE